MTQLNQAAEGLSEAPQSLVDQTKDEATRALEIQASTVTSSFMNPVVWKQMFAMADTFQKSKALPSYIQNVYQAQVVLQAGLELGLKPIEAFNSLYIVNGAVNLWGKAVIRQLKAHKYSIEYVNSTEAECTVKVTRGGESYTETLTYEEATKSISNVSSRPGWKEGINRKMKLRYNALSILIKSYIPEVLGSAEGIAEVAEDYEVIDDQSNAKSPEEKSIQFQDHKRSSAADFINRRKHQIEEHTTLVSPEEDDKGEEVPVSEQREEKAKKAKEAK